MLTYLALANSWGDLYGRPRQPSYPPPVGSMPVASSQIEQILEQTTQVVDPPAVTGEEKVTIAKVEEAAVILEEPGIVTTHDLANTIYIIPEGGEEETPTMEQDEAVKSDTDSHVSIEPYMAEWTEQQALEAPFPDMDLE